MKLPYREQACTFNHEGRDYTWNIRPTRFNLLGYRQDAAQLWRLYNLDGYEPHAVGPHYRTKAELLADLERYAREYGAESLTESPTCAECGSCHPYIGYCGENGGLLLPPGKRIKDNMTRA